MLDTMFKHVTNYIDKYFQNPLYKYYYYIL